MSKSGREAVPNVQEWSGDPSDCPEVAGRPSRITGSPYRMSGSGRLTLPDVR